MKSLENCMAAGTFAMLGLLVGLSFTFTAQAESRWYDQAIVDKGELLFKQNCASCHGQNAEGTADWKKTDADGNYPPPPLNGTAHAWHHNKELLKRTILEGGAKLGGVMPGFASQLSDQDIDAVIAFFQSKWPHQIYQKWAGSNKANDVSSITSFVENLEQATANNKITALLKKRLGNDKVSDPVPTPVDGIFETQFGSNFGYLSADGRYLFMGNLIDLEQGQNLTNLAKGLAQGDLPSSDCASASLVDRGYALGKRAGISGTPALFKSNGEIIQGYVPYQQLIPQVLGN